MTTEPPAPDPHAPSPVIADASRRNWVDNWAPRPLQPYLKLARFDRPIGAWLLLFPTWWSQAMGELWLGREHPDPWFLLLFLAGAFVMRGAGCTWNDIVDRDYDGRVERTAHRPIPSGQVTVRQALAFGAALSLVGLVILLQFNPFTVLVGASSLVLIAAYPFFKRFTHWPQFMLGLTFKWGALVGWAAVTGTLGWQPLLLYAGSILWTMGYDTIYAHQDKEDDAMLGLKSTALLLGGATRPWLAAFYAGAVVLWAAAGLASGAGWIFLGTLALIGVQLGWQVATLDIASTPNCLARFKSNQLVGWMMLAGLSADMYVATLPPQ